MEECIVSKKSLCIILLFVVIIMFWELGIAANGEEEVADSKRAYYHELEKRYETVVRKTLEIKGYANAGITINARIETDGSRTFTTKIHHVKFNLMDEEEKNELLTDISKISFTDAKSTISYVLF